VIFAARLASSLMMNSLCNIAFPVLRISVLLAALFAGGIVLAAPDQLPPSTEQAQAELDARIQALVEQLGAADYAVREKAQAELSRLGLEAFDALHQAQNNDDTEIALRARYLVRSMNVNWALASDPPEVQEALKLYGDQSAVERKSRMDRLATLDDRQGLTALCRLVRFEPDNLLSKHAAILILLQPETSDLATGKNLAKLITSTIGMSKRTAADWLRTYARTLQDAPSSLAEWDELTQAEQSTYAQYPERTSREIVRDLYRWQVALLQRLNRDAEAVAVMRRTISLLDGTPEQIENIVDWLIERQAWKVVDEIAARFPDLFNDNPILLYCLAEAQLKQGQTKLAAETAQRAMAHDSDNLPEHIRVGYVLQERGMFDWAEREFRHAIEVGPIASATDVQARFYLSEMLHDQGRELPAAEAMQGLVTAMDNDPNAQDQVTRAGREIGSIYSRMHYFYSRDFHEKGNYEREREELQKGIEKDGSDADVLIALYRLPEQSKEERDETRKLIDAAVEEFRSDIDTFRQAVESAPNEATQKQYNSGLAISLNQFAWLVGNTYGDFDEAIKASKQSLDIRPETAGYLDTLARCYYGKGDIAAAVKTQSQAAKLDPHSGQLHRQLAFFQREAAKSGKAAPAGGDAKP
jgi:tetratricopeptide (TPR) repeat protein